MKPIKKGKMVKNWFAQTYNGTTKLHIDVDSLTDPQSNSIGSPRGHDGSITIITKSCLGDVNGDGKINIVDALLVAQWYVGLNPSINFTCGDIDRSGTIDIIDALLIARLYVGTISFP